MICQLCLDSWLQAAAKLPVQSAFCKYCQVVSYMYTPMMSPLSRSTTQNGMTA